MTAGETDKKAKESVSNPLFVVAYVLTWITGLVVLVTAKHSEHRLRFHALQSIFLGIAIFVLWFVPFIGWLISFALWLVGMVVGIKAYGREDVKLPFIGGYAKEHS